MKSLVASVPGQWRFLRRVAQVAAAGVLGLLVVACGAEEPTARPTPTPTPRAPTVDPGGRLKLDATLEVFRVGTYFEFRVDGSQAYVCVDRRGPTETGPKHELSVTLGDDARQRLRRALLESRFLEEWPPDRHTVHPSTWEVTLALGDRTRTRTFTGQPDWEPVERFLVRLGREVMALAPLVERGDLSSIGTYLRSHPAMPRVLDPALAVDPLRRVARGAATPDEAHEALLLLTELIEPSAWADEVAAVVDDRDQGWRRSLLRSFPGRHALDHERELAPLCREELVVALADEDATREELCDALIHTTLLEEIADAESIPLWVEFTERCSVPDQPLPVRGLVRARPASFPAIAGLLQHDRAPVRQAGAWLAERIADQEPSGAVRERAIDELAPHLRRIERNPREERWARHWANRALVKLGLSKSFKQIDAEQEAIRRAEQERRSAEWEARRRAETPPPPPQGELTIRGRLVTDGGVPPTRFHVFAKRRDGTEAQPWRVFGQAEVDADGGFEIAGLVEGTFTLVPGSDWWNDVYARARMWAGRAEGVAAGARDVRLEVPLRHSIRGRIVDPEGAPLGHRRIFASRVGHRPHLRAHERITARAETDAQGRFWIVGLVEGQYDLRVQGAGGLSREDPIQTGTSDLELVVHPPVVPAGQVSGRVVDAEGEPIRDAYVAAMRDHERVSAAKTAADGTFRLQRIPEGEPVTVVAQAPAAFRGVTLPTTTIDDVAIGTTHLTVTADRGLSIAFAIEGYPNASAAVYWGDRRRRIHPPLTLHGVPDATFRIVVGQRRRGRDLLMEIREFEVGTIRAGERDKVFRLPPWPE